MTATSLVAGTRRRLILLWHQPLLRTGHLLVALESAGGSMAFEAGRVVHAEFGDETGRSAFASLIAAAHREGVGEFCFVADADGGLRGTPRTVHNGIDELLRES